MPVMSTSKMQMSLLTICVVCVADIGCGQGEGQSDPIDNTTCVVRSSVDDANDFNSLRAKVENGFNRTMIQFCTQLIRFDSVYGILLTKTLQFDNPQDTDCDNDSLPVCHDGIAFELQGPIILDASKLADQHCAITLNANNVLLHKVTIISRIGKAALCDQGTGNTLDVTFESPG